LRFAAVDLDVDRDDEDRDDEDRVVFARELADFAAGDRDLVGFAEADLAPDEREAVDDFARVVRDGVAFLLDAREDAARVPVALPAADLAPVDLARVDLDAPDRDDDVVERVDFAPVDLDLVDFEALGREPVDLAPVDLAAVDLEVVDLEVVALEPVDFEAVDLAPPDLDAVDFAAVARERVVRDPAAVERLVPERAAVERDEPEDLRAPDPLLRPPPVSLFTVAQARRSASLSETPRSS
jgi:hypothetical protein